VHAFERPGHGRSADVDGDYSYARGVSDTLAYLDAQGLGAVDVVGYSDGAIIGLLLALDHPTRVRSLVAISANLDPTAFTDAPGGGAPHRLLDGPPTITEDAGEEVDVERRHYERLSPDGPAHADVVLAKLVRLWTAEPHIDPARLGAVTARTLVMAGDRDTIPPGHSLLIASSIPGAQLCILPGTTHGLVGERPELISTILREFLR
jgi:pimeloyl-ACP methyl ester carboxylesterase